MASTFSVEDIRRLEKTISIRERLLDHLAGADKKLPESAKDVEALTNLAESVDRSIFSRVKINIDEANQKVNEETKEVLRDLLLDLHRNNSKPNFDNLTPKEAPKFQSSGMDLNEGELISKTDNPDISQFLENR